MKIFLGYIALNYILTIIGWSDEVEQSLREETLFERIMCIVGLGLFTLPAMIFKTSEEEENKEGD